MTTAIAQARLTSRPSRARKATKVYPTSVAVTLTRGDCTTSLATSEARDLVLRFLADRLEQARELFETLRIAASTADAAPALDFYLEIACSESVQAERALISGILARQHEGEISIDHDYSDSVHEADVFDCDGRIYLVELDPAFGDLEVGEGFEGMQVMKLKIFGPPARPAPNPARLG